MNSMSLNGGDGHIFISYSSVDKVWLDRLLRHLRPLVRDRKISVFTNRNIRVGQDWRQEIRVALESATIAVLLVSAAFLESDFIMNHELPPLLAAAAARGTVIMPVIVEDSLYEKMPDLARFQAANSPDRPLSSMRSFEWNTVLANLAREIYEIIERGK